MNARSPRALKNHSSSPKDEPKLLRIEVERLVERIARIVQENKSGAKKAALIVERWIAK
jgi:hypothetical protein